jgi:recombination protein RecA
LYGEGISKSGDLIDLAVNDGILEKSGAWFSYGGERVGQGRENARNYLQERPKLLAEIEAKILQKHGLSRGGAAAAVASESATSTKSAAASANGEAASSKSNTSQTNGAAQKPANNDDDAKSRAAAAAAAARPRPRA